MATRAGGRIGSISTKMLTCSLAVTAESAPFTANDSTKDPILERVLVLEAQSWLQKRDVNLELVEREGGCTLPDH